MKRLSEIMRVVLLLGGLGCSAAGLLHAQGVERSDLLRKQEDQERARAMTRQLLDGVLQLQRQQLEENGLTDLPVYRDIGLMREHLQDIVDQEMVKVVELLARAQSGSTQDRDATFVEARQMVRTVVVRLSAERQSLLRRLKAAELVEQAHRLIAMQTDVQTTTRLLPEEAEQRREATLLKNQEDQRDVKELFLHLVDTLDDIRTWGGPIAETAVDGLRILKAGDVGEHVDQAEVELVATHLPTALEHQAGVIKGLNDFLKLLQRQQGLLQAERNAALEKLQAIAQKQSELKSQAEKLLPNTPASTEMVEQQVEIEQQIQALAEQLPQTAAGEHLAEKAEQAAATAAEELLEADNTAAIEKQTETLANLSALEEILKRGERTALSDRSAAELAQEVAKLKDVKAQLEPVVAQQKALPEATDATAAEVAQAENNLAAQIAELATTADLPDAVAAALMDAQGELKSAAEALAEVTPDDDATDQASVNAADHAIDAALATVTAELADAERLAAAVKIGELARAAEVLERTAAEEREIAHALAEAMSAPESSAASTEQLAARQNEVAAIAEKVSAGLANIAPEVGEKVAQAAENAQQVGKELTQTAQSKANRQTATEPAKAKAEATANQLTDAASDLRSQIQAAAEALAAQSAQQAAALAQAREAVEAVKSPLTQSLNERMQQLSAAQHKARQAAADQLRAAGRPNAAEAMELAEQIAAAQTAQAAAEDATGQWERGEAATPLKAVAAQQAVAEAAADFAEEADRHTQKNAAAQDELQAAAASLKIAQTEAQEAARQLLNNETAAADAAQEKAHAALQQALAQAQSAARKSQAAEATTAPNAQAQQKAAQAAEAAAELAQGDASDAAQSLMTAAEAGDEAETALGQQNLPKTQEQQQAAQQALDVAQQKLSAAMQDLARQQTEALAQLAEKAGPLSNPTSSLDPSAGTALEAAEQAAMSGSDPLSPNDTQAAAATSAERQLERAIASLAAREQEVRRDQAVAEALASLATQQQQAAEMLATQRQVAESPETAPQVNATQAAEAARNFADAQMATGQGAVELSGQQQVANAPLRDALEMAQSLLAATVPMPPAEFLAEAAAMAQQAAPGNSDPLSPAETTGTPLDSDSADSKEGTSKTPGQAQGQSGSMPSDTGFVPQSPEKTAEMMAGPQLAQAMQQAAAAEVARNQPGTPNSQNAQTSPAGQPLETNSQAQTASQEPAAQAGSAMQTNRRQAGQTDNTGVKDGPLQDQAEGTDLGDTQGGQRVGDAEITARQLQEQPWFAKLPPELRKAMRSGTQQKAPKAYEDKLRRYFQSVD
ncbi:hypothetical protein GC163_15845 [bacterium]|nr:hypothetical protein [bacterium]